METKERMCIILMTIGFLVNSGNVHGNISEDSNKNTQFRKLLDRIAVLEKKVEEHPVQLENIRQEFDIKMEELQKSHAAEISRLRIEFDEQISRLRTREGIPEHFAEPYTKETLHPFSVDETNELLQPYGIDETESITSSPQDAFLETEPSEHMDEMKDMQKPAAFDSIKLLNHPRKPDGARGLRKRIRRAEGEITVAFFASLSSNIAHLGQNQNVKFDQVITNIGNAYDKHVGIFRAPVQGIYVFSTTLVTNNRDSAHYGFFLNSQILTVIFVNGYENAWDGSSNTIVLNLNKDDDVSVQHTDSDREVYGHSHSIFSGFLLTQIDPQLSIVG